MGAKYSEIEQKLVDGFLNLINYMSPKDAVLTLEHKVFVEHSHEFYNLTEEEQMETRKIILAMKLVHI